MNKLICFSLCLLPIVLGAQIANYNSPNTHFEPPVDGITSHEVLTEKGPLSYPEVREADVFWEKKVWRKIDTREKMNLHFRYPNATFFDILIDGVIEENFPVYSAEKDDFSVRITKQQVEEMMYQTDTIEIFEPETYDSKYQVVRNYINSDDIKYYRVKEVWYFDSKHATLKSRILGIAPILQDYDDQGNLRFERPLFWVYYPHCRAHLSNYPVFDPNNDRSHSSWEDVWEKRYFSSHVIKESNIHDRRIEDYATGVEALTEAEKIEDEIFNREQSLWSY